MLSDSESSDSDSGIRFKTTSTRNIDIRTSAKDTSRSSRKETDRAHIRDRDRGRIRGKSHDRDRDRRIRRTDSERDRYSRTERRRRSPIRLKEENRRSFNVRDIKRQSASRSDNFGIINRTRNSSKLRDRKNIGENKIRKEERDVRKRSTSLNNQKESRSSNSFARCDKKIVKEEVGKSETAPSTEVIIKTELVTDQSNNHEDKKQSNQKSSAEGNKMSTEIKDLTKKCKKMKRAKESPKPTSSRVIRRRSSSLNNQKERSPTRSVKKTVKEEVSATEPLPNTEDIVKNESVTVQSGSYEDKSQSIQKASTEGIEITVEIKDVAKKCKKMKRSKESPKSHSLKKKQKKLITKSADEFVALTNESTSAIDVKDSSEIVIGPILPIHLKDNQSTNIDNLTPIPELAIKRDIIIGPTLPPHLREKLFSSKSENIEVMSHDLDDGDVIGPLPIELQANSKAFIELEERALKIKMAKLGGSGDNKDETVREEWMLSLPEVKAANIGLGPRQFRAKAGPDMSDRTGWTETPSDKAKKDAQGPLSIQEVALSTAKEAQLFQVARRDEEQEKMIKKHKKKHKRDESLLDLHKKKLKKKKRKEEKAGLGNERRRFDRDIDLKANKFDEAQKKAIFKKAQLLDTRFSRGEAKFL